MTYKYFKLSEFDSPDAPGSGAVRMNRDFVAVLDKIRERCGFPLVVTSGYRTTAHNAKVGGSSGSAHVLGLAADLRIPAPMDRNRSILYDIARAEGITRIGIGDTFIHFDMNKNAAQNVTWLYR